MTDDIPMPWGKYKGDLICDLPSGYLYWLAKNCEDDRIANPADEEYRWRTDNNKHWYDD